MSGLVAVIEKNSTEEIRINLTEFKGTDLIDIRIYWNKSDDESIPTRKGISLNIDKLDELIAGLNKVREEISR